MTKSEPASRAATVATGGLLATLGGLAARYGWNQWRIERAWLVDIAAIGEVDELSIVPVVERLASRAELQGEPGVSYVLRAGSTRLLFGTGLNARSVARPALVHNAELLRVNLPDLDGVVISHPHADHVGGPRTQFRKTFAFRPTPWSREASPRTCRRTCDTIALMSWSRRHQRCWRRA